MDVPGCVFRMSSGCGPGGVLEEVLGVCKGTGVLHAGVSWNCGFCGVQRSLVCGWAGASVGSGGAGFAWPLGRRPEKGSRVVPERRIPSGCGGCAARHNQGPRLGTTGRSRGSPGNLSAPTRDHAVPFRDTPHTNPVPPPGDRLLAPSTRLPVGPWPPSRGPKHQAPARGPGPRPLACGRWPPTPEPLAATIALNHAKLVRRLDPSSRTKNRCVFRSLNMSIFYFQ